MVKLWISSLLVLASLCVVQPKPYHEEKHRALLRTGYVYFPGGGYYRLAHKTPAVWAEARRNCQQEGATLAIVNSEREAENLRSLYFDYGPVQRKLQDTWSVSAADVLESSTELPATTQAPARENATVHIGFHDIFIEGEYLTIRNEPLIMSGFIRWKIGYPVADADHNCGGFDTGKYILDNRCDQVLPYICEIPEAP